jgi:hypothetical protein
LEVIAPGADPDLDGNNNLAEFFAGTLPLVTSPRETIRISGNIAALTLVSREPTTIAAPLEVRWETSGNLATWTDVTADVVLENESPADAGFVERSYRLNPAGDPTDSSSAGCWSPHNSFLNERDLRRTAHSLVKILSENPSSSTFSSAPDEEVGKRMDGKGMD